MKKLLLKGLTLFLFILFITGDMKTIKADEMTKAVVETTTEELITTKVVEKETVKRLSVFEKKKVKGVKTCIKKSTYKSWGVKNGNYALKKFTYKKGYKISWKKISKVKKYEVKLYRYSPVYQKYVFLKEKTTKKTYYVFTGTHKGEKYKVKVRGIKGNEYTKYSSSVKFKSAGNYRKIKTDKLHNVIEYTGYNRYEDEKAFVLQNKERTAKGVTPLKWSEELYNIAKIRSKFEMTKDESLGGWSHEYLHSNSKQYFKNKYGIDDVLKTREFTNLGENLNDAGRGWKSAIQSWKNSPGHYRNMTKEDYYCGAIACYECHNNEIDGNLWTALFTECEDYDKEVKKMVGE